MPYHLLTGATGLLGCYLMRDLLDAGSRLAVLVRPNKIETARGRIETVMARWDEQAGYALPRPVVLEGDITQPQLGLDAQRQAWVSEHCESVIHSAASLTFHATDPAGEPWRSNVEGTRHVLELCERAGIEQFHHVSTAYVCGLRSAAVYEDESDVGQTPGNDYERTKLLCEAMVRDASFLRRRTFYRPSIIFGDSQTGYTTTFHGFYAPLKLLASLLSQVRPADRLDYSALLQVLGLRGTERKNFVPVDWVARTICDIHGEPRHHGRTYHLTAAQPVSSETAAKVMDEALWTYGRIVDRTNGHAVSRRQLGEMFREQLAVYRSYWRDDPDFDQRNTLAVATACPEVDEAMLLRTSKFAIETNFGWPRPAPIVPPRDVHKFLRQRHVQRHGERASGSARVEPGVRLGLQVNGRGGGQWEIAWDRGQIVDAREGLSQRCSATFYMNSNTFDRLACQHATVDETVSQGHLLIEGNGLPSEQLAGILQEFIRGPVPRAHR